MTEQVNRTYGSKRGMVSLLEDLPSASTERGKSAAKKPREAKSRGGQVIGLIVLVFSLVVGAGMITTACLVWAVNARFGLGGTLLTLLGVALIGLTLWGRVQIKANSIEVKFEQNRQVVRNLFLSFVAAVGLFSSWTQLNPSGAILPGDTPLPQAAAASPTVASAPASAPPAEEFQAASQPPPPDVLTDTTAAAPPAPERHKRRVALEQAGVAPTNITPMQPGALISRGMPNIEPPVPLDIPAYTYPDAARGSGRKVSVRLSLLVDENGRVLEATVVAGDGSAFGFDEAALAAARQVVFQPATREGIPGKMWTDLILEFAE